ncbi:unnamed protein product, partial [Ascophyllum nodosum]
LLFIHRSRLFSKPPPSILLPLLLRGCMPSLFLRNYLYFSANVGCGGCDSHDHVSLASLPWWWSGKLTRSEDYKSTRSLLSGPTAGQLPTGRSLSDPGMMP